MTEQMMDTTSQRPNTEDDDGAAGQGVFKSQSHAYFGLSGPKFWRIVGFALALLSSTLLFAACQILNGPLALLAAFASGLLALAAIALVSVVAYRGAALYWASSLLSPLDFLPPTLRSSNLRNIHERRTGGQGDITLIGAGCGSISQLTLEAFAALQDADVVICDRVLPSQLHAAVPQGAVLHVAEKIPGNADVAQAELFAWGIAALREGRRVVRLKVRCQVSGEHKPFPHHSILAHIDRSATPSCTDVVARRSYFTGRR